MWMQEPQALRAAKDLASGHTAACQQVHGSAWPPWTDRCSAQSSQSSQSTKGGVLPPQCPQINTACWAPLRELPLPGDPSVLLGPRGLPTSSRSADTWQ